MLLGILVLVNVLSSVDWMLTGLSMQRGAAEGNLFIGMLLGVSPVAAALFKAIVILAVTIGIWRWRWYRAVLGVAVGSLAVFALLIVYEIVGLVSISA